MRIASFSRTDMVTWPGRQVSVLVVDGSDGPGEDPEAVAAVAGRDTDIVDAMIVRSSDGDPEALPGIHRLIKAVRPKGLPVVIETSGRHPDELDDLIGAGYATGIGLLMDGPADADQRRSIRVAEDNGGTFDAIVRLDAVMPEETILVAANSVEGYGMFVLRMPARPAPGYDRKRLDALAKSLRGRARNVRVGRSELV